MDRKLILLPGISRNIFSTGGDSTQIEGPVQSHYRKQLNTIDRRLTSSHGGQLFAGLRGGGMRLLRG